VDVRVLAATARSLGAEVAAGRFREDLYYRLNVVTIQLPPLAARREDIVPLAHHFAARLASRLGRAVDFTPAALAWLEAQPWPGNVRELEHTIERAAILSDHPTLDGPDFVAGGPVLVPRPGSQAPATLKDAAEQAEREAILAALSVARGNRKAAAERLDVSLRTLFYKMQRYGIE
jgi:DNA-binding NtrC family response regulator